VTSTEYPGVLLLNSEFIMATSRDIQLSSDAKHREVVGLGFDSESGAGLHRESGLRDVVDSSSFVGGEAMVREPGGIGDFFGVEGLMKSLVGLDADRLKVVNAYCVWQAERCRVQALQLASVSESAQEPSVELSSEVTSRASSRVSRRSARRQVYLDECMAAAEVDGFCYLKLVRLPSRLAVRERIGPNPGVERLLSMRSVDLDLGAMRNLEFERSGDCSYHVQHKEGGDALGFLRRTLYNFPRYGLSMREVLGVENSSGDFMSLRATVGASAKRLESSGGLPVVDSELVDYRLSQSVESDRRVLQSVLDRSAAVIYHAADWREVRPEAVKVDHGFVECSFEVVTDGYRSYRFGPVWSSGVVVLPSGYHARDASVRVGSDDRETCVVFQPGGVFHVEKSEQSGVVSEGDQLSGAMARMDLEEAQVVKLRVVELEGRALAFWRHTRGYLGNKTTEARFAAENSVFYVHSLPRDRGGVETRVLVEQITDPYDRWASLRDVRGTMRVPGASKSVLLSECTQRFGVNVIRRVCHENKVYYPCRVAGIASLLSVDASLALNCDRAKLSVEIEKFDAKYESRVSFHIVTVQDEYCFDNGGPSGSDFSDAY